MITIVHLSLRLRCTKNTKTSIIQQLQTDLGQSVEVTTATKLVWFTGFIRPTFPFTTAVQIYAGKNVSQAKHSSKPEILHTDIQDLYKLDEASIM